MRVHRALLAAALTATFSLVAAPQAWATCFACGSAGEYCSDCTDGYTCAAVYEDSMCHCRNQAGGCIAWLFCYYSSHCGIADGGRLDCPLRPLPSILVPSRRSLQLPHPGGPQRVEARPTTRAS